MGLTCWYCSFARSWKSCFQTRRGWTVVVRYNTNSTKIIPCLCVLSFPISDSYHIRFGWLNKWTNHSMFCASCWSFFFSLQVISEIVESCRSHEITDLILVHEHRGQPDGLIVCHLPLGPTAYFGLLNVVSVHVCSIYDDLRRCTARGAMFGVNVWFHFRAGNTAWYQR
jgi:hypothetical protein